MKKQCSTYSNLNLASETKSLMRIIECCQQAAHNISTDNRLHGTTSMEKASMEEFTKDLYITGIIFLDETGTVTSEYCTDSIGSAGLTDTLKKKFFWMLPYIRKKHTLPESTVKMALISIWQR